MRSPSPSRTDSPLQPLLVGLQALSVVYSGTDGSGMLRRAEGIGGSGIEDGNESTSSWSLAGSSE